MLLFGVVDVGNWWLVCVARWCVLLFVAVVARCCCCAVGCAVGCVVCAVAVCCV